MLSDEEFKFIIDNTQGMALDAIWLYLEENGKSYNDRKTKFLWVFNRMLSDGIIKLEKNEVLIDAPIEDVINNFHLSLPENDEDVNNGVWFFTESCPAGIGWALPDGSIDWA